MKVLVSDPLSNVGIEIFKNKAGIGLNNVARDVAHQITEYLLTGTAPNIVNRKK